MTGATSGVIEPAHEAAPAQLQNRDTCVTSLGSAKWLPFLLLGIASILVWGQTVTFGFVWDDTFFIKDLEVLRSWRHFPEIFYRLDAQSTMPKGFLLFRPVRTAMWALLFHLGGKETPQPWIYHLANVLWHGATAMMLFATLTRLAPRFRACLNESQTRVWALLVALAFLVHPVVSEVVCWAKSLDDIMAAFFVLAALRELLDPLKESSVNWRPLLFFGLAVYAKESAVPFAVLPLVISRGIQRLSWKQSLLRTIPFLMVAALYTVHRHFVIGRTSQVDPISGTYGQTLLDMLPVVPKYLRLLWGVGPFCIDYTYMKGGYSVMSGAVLTGLLLLLGLVVAGLVAWRVPKTVLAGFGSLWAGLFLLPVSNLVPMMQYMAERFLYLPLIGFLIAIASLALIVPARKGILVASVGLISIWAVTAWNRSWIWHDAVTLFTRSCTENPQTWRLRENAMFAILELPAVREVMPSNSSTPPEHPGPPTASTQMKALKELEMGYHLFPEEAAMLSAYGACLAQCGQPEQALPFLEKAAQLETNNVKHLVNLARARIDVNQLVSARATLEKATLLAPDNIGVLEVALKCYWLQQEYSAARQVLLKLNKLAPNPENAYWLSEAEKKLAQPNK